MSDPDAPAGGAEVRHADVFGVLANETRMAIVRALARGHGGEDSTGFGVTLSFSELRDAVGLRDSGQFNYHLDKLTGRFVIKTDEGYRLTYTGGLLYRLAEAGLFAPQSDLEPFETSVDCLHCETPLEATYSDGIFRITCPGCEREYMSWQLPPTGTAAWDGEELLGTFDQYIRHHILLLNHDICVRCAGHMPPSVRTWTDDQLTGTAGDVMVSFERECRRCGEHLITTAGEAVLYHPATVAFFYERGTDITERYLWNLGFVVDQRQTIVRAEDPWELAVTLACDGDERMLVLDDNADVVAVEG
ncbi:MAG: ArsR/SmtB family transcription factor [Haloglomus sp.]